MNPPVGERLPDSECNAECVGTDQEKAVEDKNKRNHCGGEKKMSVYRLTIPNQKPNDGARLIKDGMMCSSKATLLRSKTLFLCAEQVRENIAKGGPCAQGAGYFNWEA